MVSVLVSFTPVHRGSKDDQEISAPQVRTHANPAGRRAAELAAELTLPELKPLANDFTKTTTVARDLDRLRTSPGLLPALQSASRNNAARYPLSTTAAA